MKHEITPLGEQVGELTETPQNGLKLNPGIPVATGILSDHAQCLLPLLLSQEKRH